ncbi:hypothetical protein [Flavilitoribacter nigricans]|uniref:Uncharacterized protein n=1 Tax=Flavilitoribacter nigricans (strain ATCC 23147 / DSM 23189 / NBRC 102662 / NCIMB 1420 / SS-2) TaxID=1122177 RepID=A0A2D0N9N5_FLAN2|nr:hypothetical protein [Flavilitoribacter nigricans]PHN05187.1 hypothetical protein CRP01_16845 [Flavilitoribacter nigricans DSM 23189 = NBRC 102662]
MRNSMILLSRLVRYNLKIIFAGRFFLFLLAALAFYIFFMVVSVFDNVDINIGTLYELTFFPGILLIFYPTVFGIQRDEDARMLEILFGIPDYRYKVWLVRLVLIFTQIFILLFLFAALGSWLLYPINPLQLATQLIFPMCFLGSLAFLLSTRVKNGNATAVIIVLLGVALSIFSEIFENTMWDLYLNPFDMARGFSQVTWQQVVWKNRIFLSVGAVVFILTALLNLQKRERYI